MCIRDSSTSAPQHPRQSTPTHCIGLIYSRNRRYLVYEAPRHDFRRAASTTLPRHTGRPKTCGSERYANGCGMAKIKITKRTVEALKVTGRDYIAFDTDLPGFGVRVMPSGKRFFLVQYRRHGRTRRVMIGQFGIVTAELARREATTKLGSVRGADGDPAAVRDADRQSTTMKELGQRFLGQYVPVRCKLSTQAEYRRCVESVSYTHLDVYKRQALPVAGSRTDDLSDGMAANDDGVSVGLQSNRSAQVFVRP